MFRNVLWCIGHELLMPNIVKAEGCCLYDSKGNEYLDFESGTWCVAAGHNHPSINKAIKKQLGEITHTGYCYSHAVVEEAAKKVQRITSLQGGKCVFLSSGSEAVEFGVQLLRTISQKPKLLTFTNSFLSSYGSSGSKRDDEWFLFDWDECAVCKKECSSKCPKLLDIPVKSVGGFVFEPGSTSGIVKFPPKKLIRNIISLIKKSRGYIQVNEITTGMGSTGKWFGFQHYDLQPDIVSIGKRLGNGYPVSAVSISREIVTEAEKCHFKYSQSHQNDPLGCAVANAVIDLIKTEKLVEKSRKSGKYLIKQLHKLQAKYPVIKDIRGRGLMIAVEFSEELPSQKASEIFRKLLKEKCIIAKRPGLNIFRIDPPLVVTKKQLNHFLSTLEKIISGFAGGNKRQI